MNMPSTGGNSITRVMVVDDHAVVRSGLRLLINSQRDMQVVAEASYAREAIELAQNETTDVVIMDLSLPDMGGIAATEEIVRVAPGVGVIALTMHEDQAYVRSFFAAHGSGYVPKRAADTHLLDAIRAVRRGQRFLEPDLSGRLLPGLLEVPSRSRQSKAVKPVLSKREQSVLELLAQGYSNGDIGLRMNISVKTVDTYRARLSTKLSLRSRPEIVRYAVEMGLLTPDRLQK